MADSDESNDADPGGFLKVLLIFVLFDETKTPQAAQSCISCPMPAVVGARSESDHSHHPVFGGRVTANDLFSQNQCSIGKKITRSYRQVATRHKLASTARKAISHTWTARCSYLCLVRG